MSVVSVTNMRYAWDIANMYLSDAFLILSVNDKQIRTYVPNSWSFRKCLGLSEAVKVPFQRVSQL